MAESPIRGDLAGIEFNVDVQGMFTEEAYQKDIDRIFKKAWLPIGHDYDLPNPGDYKTRRIPGLNYNVLIVRDKENRIRAFHNVCRHRGNLLVCKEAGNSRQGFSCGYHGWTYNIDGSLRAMTDSNQFPPHESEALGLREIRCEVRHTFIFLNFDKDAENLDSWLGELASPDLYEGFFENFRSTGLTSATIRTNWNLCMDAFSEAYHTLFVHKNTAKDYLGSSDNPMRHNPAVEVMRWHARIATAANPEHKWSPTEKLAYKYAARAFPSFDSDSSGLPAGVNFGKIDSWAFDVVKFFPNLIMLTGRDWFIEVYAWPLAADRTLCEFNTFLRNPKTYGERVAQEFSYVVTREIAQEDLYLLERQQSALENGAVTNFFLSFQELVVAHHYRNRARLLSNGEGR
ncbi:MAG TPA: aromatic ring-hydroxylating dioxygenase subunit alpha [Candidatus Binataceae bacterium]|jgi:phenylpropionate dioxygenase-like ring-hydroxylating dioxygenase large terminal subunit